ncbi:MAG: hypothetical protein IKF71_02720 [Bacilli bacterium]|nr:hypothetical protein [Bacilli bacterium]
MGAIETQATHLAIAERERTMRNHMRDNSGDQVSGFAIFNDEYMKKVMQGFISLALDTAFNDQLEKDRLRNYYEEFKEDISKYFEKINEETLEDPNYSDALITGREYTRSIGNKVSFISFSPVKKLQLDMQYVPGVRADDPNKIRLVAKEALTSEEYPCHIISIDIGDDKMINLNPPVKRDSQGVEEMVSVDDTEIPLNDDIFDTQDVFMDLFQKSGIKTQSEEENKSLSN